MFNSCLTLSSVVFGARADARAFCAENESVEATNPRPRTNVCSFIFQPFFFLPSNPNSDPDSSETIRAAHGLDLRHERPVLLSRVRCRVTGDSGRSRGAPRSLADTSAGSTPAPARYKRADRSAQPHIPHTARASHSAVQRKPEAHKNKAARDERIP